MDLPVGRRFRDPTLGASATDRLLARTPGRTHPSDAGLLIIVADFQLVDFNPAAGQPHGWAGLAAPAPVQMDLAFLLASNIMGLPLQVPLKFELLNLHIDLVTRLIDAPPVGLLRRVPEFANASLSLRRFCSEAVGTSVAAALAHLLHGWLPANGWPVDLDLNPGAGPRPDIEFPVPGGQVVAEARGRSQGRQILVATKEQGDRMLDLAAWTAANAGVKLFMAWAWITTQATRVDYFDPGRPVRLHDDEAVERSIRSRAAHLEAAARAFELPEADIPGRRIVGRWLSQPASGVDVFLGIERADAFVVDLHADARQDEHGEPISSSSALTGPASQVGPVVIGVRETGEERIQIADLILG